MRQHHHHAPGSLAREFSRRLADPAWTGDLDPAACDEVYARRQRLVASFFRHERDWRFSPGDHGDPAAVSAFALRREVFIARAARARVDADGQLRDPLTYERALDAARHAIKYFPLLFISAPHIETGVTGTFPGIPTPLLYATAVLDRALRIDEFPCFRVPEIAAVMNPAVYDETFERELEVYLHAFRPHVVGISNLSEGHHFALRIARRVKATLPDTIVILGGSHEDGTNPIVYRRAAARALGLAGPLARGVPRADPRTYDLSEAQLARLNGLQTLALDEERAIIDFVAAGDGPYLLMELMKTIADHVDAPIDEIKRRILERRDAFARLEGSGYLFFHLAGSLAHVTLSGVPLDRNALPFMYLGHLTQENRFPVFNGKKTAQVMACAGCKYACAFCFESADQVLYEVPKLREREADNVVKELELLREQGYEAVFFDDSTFTQNPAMIGRLLDRLVERRARVGSDLEWGCQTTINDVNPALLQKMATAGCTYIYFGLESAEPAADPVRKVGQLRVITHDCSWADRFRRVASWCHDVGIRVGTSLQFGLSESLAQRLETLDLVAELYAAGYIEKRAVALNIHTPYPGTDAWLERMKAPDPLPDYREPLRRHPGFETAHQFAALSRATADELYALAVERLGDAIVGVSSGAARPPSVDAAAEVLMFLA